MIILTSFCNYYTAATYESIALKDRKAADQKTTIYPTFEATMINTEMTTKIIINKKDTTLITSTLVDKVLDTKQNLGITQNPGTVKDENSNNRIYNYESYTSVSENLESDNEKIYKSDDEEKEETESSM